MTDRRKETPTPEVGRDDELEVEVEKLIAGGEGLARFRGLPIFVARAVPGDRLRVSVTERKSGYARAEIVEVIEPGAGRREPRCGHFGDCGGCDLQHLEETLQVRYKAAATIETLERLARLDLPEPRIVSGDPWGYRMRTQLHSDRGRGREGEPTRVGYHARGSHRIVPVEECPVLVGDLETAVRRLPAGLEEALPSRLDLTVGDDGSLSTAPVVEGLPHGEVSVRVGELDYALDARCFFQGHRGLLPDLVETVVGTDRGSLAVDLYAGVGLFALPLSRRYERVIAVEGDRVAARYGRLNARRNGADNIEVLHQAVESWLPQLGRDCERVIVDPPRTGLARSVVARLLERRPALLTYVSCHPAALARDLKALSNGYRVDRLALLDLFPQTGHMEVVAQLSAVRPAPTS